MAQTQKTCAPLVGANDNLIPQFATIHRRSIAVKAPRARGVRKPRNRNGASDDEGDKVVSSDSEDDVAPPAPVLDDNDIVDDDSEPDDLVSFDDTGDSDGSDGSDGPEGKSDEHSDSDEQAEAVRIESGTYDFWTLIEQAQWSDRDQRQRNKFEWHRYWTPHQHRYLQQELNLYTTELSGALSIAGIWDIMPQYNTPEKKYQLCMHIVARGKQTFSATVDDPMFAVGLQSQENGFERLFQ